MIYRENANFSYPVLCHTSHSYIDNDFHLDVDIRESNRYYHFDLNIELNSLFMNDLISNDTAQLILIIQSADSKFFKLGTEQETVSLHKSRVSLNKRTSIQVHIQALEDISFINNNDLSEFYLQFKEELYVPKHSLLGFSNVVLFDGRIKKPFDLFEKKLNEQLNSDIKIELGNETIIIQYKNNEYLFNDIPQGSGLINPYIYTGLTKAFLSFIWVNGRDGEVYIDEMSEPDGLLDLKLFNLMNEKGITDLNIDNIDEVIYKISDHIIGKFNAAVRRLDKDDGS